MNYREYREQKEIKQTIQAWKQVTRREYPTQLEHKPKPSKPKATKPLAHRVMLATLNEYRRVSLKERELIDRIAELNTYLPKVSNYSAMGIHGNKKHDIADKLAQRDSLITQLNKYVTASSKAYRVLMDLDNQINPLDALYLCSVYGRSGDKPNYYKTDRIITKLLAKNITLPPITI